MGFLNKIKENRNQSSGIANPAQWIIEMFNPNSNSGISVTEENAMHHTGVYAAVRVIAETIASLPLNVYRENKDGTKNKAKNNYLYKLLHNKPNELMTSFTWRETLMTHLLLWGNHYSQLEYSNDGKVTGIWPLMPGNMQVKRRGKTLYYIYNSDSGEQQIYDQREILHIPGLGFNGLVGKSVISMAREAIGLGLSAEEFGARFFSQGAQPGGIVEYPSTLSDPAFQRYKKEVQNKYQGLGNAHKIMVLEEGMKYHQTGIPPDDAQFLETRKFQIEEIARIFRVPPHMLADLERATFSNIEQQSIDFVVNTIRPWLVRIEQSLNDKLLGDRNSTNYIKFVVEGLLRGDVESRGNFYNTMFNIGAMSINDIREKEDMNPIENGDQNFVPLNMIPLKDADAEINTTGDRSKFERRSIRSATTRRNIRERYARLIETSAKKIVQKEVNKIRDLVNKELKNEQNFREEIIDFYEEFPNEISEELQPVLYSLADAAAEEAGKEVDFSDYDIEEFKREYVESNAERYAGYSRGQLLALMDEADTREESVELVEERIGEWEETKADKFSSEQAVKLESAITRTVFMSAGITKLIWIANDGACPICMEMDGAIVGIEQNFIGPNDSIDVQGGFSPNTPRAHPPLHDKCVCSIGPA